MVSAASRPAAKPALRKTTVGVVASAMLALTLAFSGTATADELDDRKAAIEAEQQKTQETYEYLDAETSRKVAELAVYQQQLPGAQQSLTDAEGRVSTAAGKVGALTDRVALAQETRNTITSQIASDQEAMDDTQDVIGQIAAQAYKSGGVPSSFSLILGAEGAESLTDSMGLAEQVMRSQNAAMQKLSEQSATNLNSEARLAAVEEEISSLKVQAEAALKVEQEARDAAAAEKAKVDTLIEQTAAANAALEARKPIVQAQLASLETAKAKANADIAERQREQLEKARKEEEARVAEANRQAAAEAARANRPAPAPQVPSTTPTNPSAFGLRMPVNAPISSGFGWRGVPAGTIDFYGNGGYLHSGVDFAAQCGTPVYAPAGGNVWKAIPASNQSEMIGAGNYVVLDHGVIGRSALATNYYHLTSYVVSQGQYVNAGQLIGYVGTTGNSTGCHLHFETILNGAAVNPMGLL
ncbi:peptidoglycan DD-metalloendopeptidase family protein [Arthrobacter jiangjiafuii]|uniref:Peptidoglycan DD-metalloendopeptidase family protein n=1 Tax=Arthrobacter jiangjiafuii TaxID=2817475 RepID=A0A975M3M1_9MICC|nr:M23 family metallopeptidase [Arthrobacter jiangjiafuii]MBP3044640.1 peptidoglycan DD-metalloendopeptidase family protein [Arthrobacter jiangjiafuii]QWC09267.1 peptidoglycan DD-metalloendopeptidase family protein [Arthrobacter jiangjiafuii]